MGSNPAGRARRKPRKTAKFRGFSLFLAQALDAHHIGRREDRIVALDCTLQVEFLSYAQFANLEEHCLIYRLHKDNITSQAI